MQKIRYENSKGEYLDFGYQRPLILQRITGTGNVDVNVHTQRSPFQDGRTYLGSHLEPREIFVQLAILTTDSTELFVQRELIQKIFNPKLGEGILYYDTPNGMKKIHAIVEGTPSFSNYNGDNVECQINFLCSDPFWYDVEDTDYTFNAPYVPIFEFPFFSDTENPLEFGLEREEVTIMNTGTVYTPLIIEFEGGFKNATFTNLTTGEFITINKELLVGEILTVDTSFGQRKLKVRKLDGMEENGFKYITLDSKFLQLQEGENDIRYEAEADGRPVTVRLKWHVRYLGL